MKYLWVTGLLIGLSAWIPLRGVANTDLSDSSGGWAMPALCTPPTGEGQRGSIIITAFINTAKKFLSVTDEMWVMMSMTTKRLKGMKNFAKNLSA